MVFFLWVNLCQLLTMFFLEVHPAYLFSNGMSLMKHNVLCRVSLWHTDRDSIICLSSAILSLWIPPPVALDFLLTHVIINLCLNYNHTITITFYCYVSFSEWILVLINFQKILWQKHCIDILKGLFNFCYFSSQISKSSPGASCSMNSKTKARLAFH